MLQLLPYLKNLKNLLANEEGQDLIEYALIIVVIVIAAAIGLAGVGDQIALVFQNILTWLTTEAVVP